MPGFNSIDGLASGLSTTEIIDTIMQYERQPAALLEQQQAQKQTVVSALQALQAKFIGLSSSMAPLTFGSTFEKSKVQVSNEDILTATADGRVGKGSYSFQVLQVAKNHQIASQGFAVNDAATFGTGSITIQVGKNNLREVTINSENNTLSGIKDAINKANIGVTASLVNDGTSSNSYRMILTADKTGASNSIAFNSNLTGGTDSFNFTTATFDNPELLSVNDASTSAINLGTTASFTGNENKSYTFTVSSAGSQTIGSDVITLDWTDGTNSGQVVVTQADTEVFLAGAGSDGLSLMFSAGDLNEGDTFQIDTFAPLLQSASDAKIAFGGSGYGSPITISSATNTFKDVIENVDLTVKSTTAAGETVEVNTDIDITGIKSKIDAFLTSYNDVVKFIDEQNKYTEGKDAPPLLGDTTVWTITNSMRRNIGSVVEGIDSKYNQLYSIGIRTKADGTMAVVDSSRLETALRESLDDVISLFSSTGKSSNTGIEYLASTDDTKDDFEFNVDITQAATKGGFKSSNRTDLSTANITLDSSNNRIKLKVDGLLSDEILLTEKTYTSTTELIEELQEKINKDAKIGNRSVLVEWVDNGDGTGFVDFKSGSYGSTSKIEMNNMVEDSAYNALGFDTGVYYAGLDVVGTINGEEAKGKGQILSGIEGNKTTEGIQLKITLTEAELVEGFEGTLSVTKGVASKQAEYIRSITKTTTGIFDRKISSEQKQIENMTKRIEDIDERLALRREFLFQQFYDMETALSQLKSESEFLSNQLAGINLNWKASNNN